MLTFIFVFAILFTFTFILIMSFIPVLVLQLYYTISVFNCYNGNMGATITVGG